MLSRTTSMDADTAGHDLRVTVQHRRVDYENMPDEVAKRIVSILRADTSGCHYVNPAVTVSCRTPSQAFMQTVRKQQAAWCRRFSRMFPELSRRSVKDWASHEYLTNRKARYLDRALTFTGILFIDGRIIPPNQWSQYENTGR